jgi:glycosyltransferase involved in cell wall biosynthesis
VIINTKHGRNRTDLPRQVVMNRVLGHFSSCVVPVSEDAAAVAREIERVPPSKLNVIRNGIDLESFDRPLVRHRFRKRAIHVARLNLVKDQVTLLKAARIVLNSAPDFQLDIVGDGPSKEELLACHRELGLDDSVRFLGHQDDVRSALADADLFVLSSLSEGISLTLLEAMAMRLPVVATNVGGNREVVVHNQSGLLVPAQSPPQLADAMLTILSDPAKARAMGDAGRLRVEEHFDVRRSVEEYARLYRHVIGRNVGFKREAYGAHEGNAS